MKVLVTGGRGMLGTDVCAVFASAGHEVLPVGSADFDITDMRQTVAAIQAAAPDLVIHAAAYTDVDGCERDPVGAFTVNAKGAGNICLGASAVGAQLIAISTDFVFDGHKREPYIESDPVNPLGIYGTSKLMGEKFVLEIGPPDSKIVRTSWLYGASGKCFPKTMIQLAQTRPELRVVGDQTGGPTYTRDLAAALLDLTDVYVGGVYHITNSGQCTWAELAQETLRLAGLGHVTVTPIKSEEWPTPTERPKYSVLRPNKLEMLGKPPLRVWTEALAEFVPKVSL